MLNDTNEAWLAEAERLADIFAVATSMADRECYTAREQEKSAEAGCAKARAALLAHLRTRPQPDHFVEATEKVHLAATPAVGALRAAPLREQLNTIRLVFQYWLDWQLRSREEEGIATDDTTIVMNSGYTDAPPDWPNRRVLKAWIAVIDAASIAVNGEATPASNEPDGKDDPLQEPKP